MKNLLLYIFAFLSINSFSQETLSEILNKFNSETIPYISVQELAMPKTKAVILDARELIEYNVSHLKDAIFVGYENFQIDSIQNKLQDKSGNIVVYCTLGVRSEDIAEKLKAAGYTNVQNLYGGIIEWKNNDFKVFNSDGKETDNVHVCNEFWSKWLNKGIKVYE